MTHETACIFCRIIAGSAPASFVHEDEEAVAFLDINPVAPGHLLVVPRRHLPDLADVPPDLASHMFLLAQELAAALRATDLRTEGINLFYADGAAALQSVFHSHLHVIPRYAGDGFRIHAENWGANPGRDELDAHAALVRTAREKRA